MLFQAPQERKEDLPKGIHFHYLSVKPGECVLAYLAAKPLWLYTHTVKRRTKLCVRRASGGTVPCILCEQFIPTNVKGWVCCYRASDGRPVAVWVSEESRAVCDKLALHERIVLTRERNPGSPVAVARQLCGLVPYQTTLAERQTWADPEPSLLRIVQQPELSQWVTGNHAPPIQPPKLPETEQTPLPAPPKPVVAEEDEKTDAHALAEVLDKLRAKIGKMRKEEEATKDESRAKKGRRQRG